MTGVIENMPAEARLERMQNLADLLVKIVRENNGPMLVSEALNKLAAELRTAISQIKYGLNYALSNSMLSIGSDDRLVAA